MVIKRYSVSLEEDIVKQAQRINENSGRKLSPVINMLLRDWIEKHKEELDD